MVKGNDATTTKSTAARKSSARSPKRGTSVKMAAPKEQQATTDAIPTARTFMIAEAAYYKAQARNFEPGREIEDWCSAERDIEAMVGR